MRLLITGGAGFIGSNFIHYILKKYPEYKITNLDLLTYAGNAENHKHLEGDEHYTFVKGDINDEKLVDELVKNTDAIVHFAAESHVDRSIASAQDFVRTNFLGTYVLLEAARNNGNKRFHHISTDEVFGALKKGEAEFHEGTPYNPQNPYSASKAGADHLVRAYHNTYGLPVTISNCSNNYGPYHFPEKFIPLAITNLMEGKKIPVYGQGKQIRDWLYVEDHCSAIDLILHKGKIGETYLLGGDNQPTNLDIAKRIVQLLGKDTSAIQFITDRPGHDYRYAIKHAKITQELGWQPSTTLDEGLEKTFQWYKDNENWWKRVKSGKYQKYYKEQYKM